MQNNNSRPEMEFKVGAVRATIWANPRSTSDGRSFESHRISIERTFKDMGGFRSTNSLETNDIPKAILALKQAYEWILCSEKKMEEAPSYSRSSSSPILARTP